MAEETNIEWTDATVNFWWGCTEISPGCDNCYAREWSARFTPLDAPALDAAVPMQENADGSQTPLWGAGGRRRKIKGAVSSIRRMNSQAESFFAKHGRRRRVFMQSMSDVFDVEVDAEWRAELFAEAEAATNLDIQMLTKRSANVRKLAPEHWLSGQWPRHIGLMFSIVNQKEANRDIPRLLNLKKDHDIPWVGISAEPLLGMLRLREIPFRQGNQSWLLDALTGKIGSDRNRRGPPLYEPTASMAKLDWVICGGESGLLARPMHPDWARQLRMDCFSTETPFLFKQWGEWLPECQLPYVERGTLPIRPFDAVEVWRHPDTLVEYRPGRMVSLRTGKKIAGRLMDGRATTEFPSF